MKALLTLAAVATFLSTPREEAGIPIQNATPNSPIRLELEKLLAEAKAGERAAESAGNHDAGCFERGRQAAFTELIFMVKRRS